MTILFVTDNYTPGVNGIVAHIITIRNELRRRGHRVIIVAPKLGKKTPKEKDVFRLPATIPFPLKPPDLLTFPFDSKIENTLLDMPIDIVHNHLLLTGFFGLRIAKKKNIPAVATVHTLFRYYVDWMVPWGEKKIKYRITDWFAKNYFNGYDAVIAPSTKAIDSLLAARVTAPIRLINNGIDLQIFNSSKPDVFVKKFTIDPKRPLVVVVSRIDKGKNIELVIKGIKRVKEKIPNILLVIVGDGTERKKIEKLVKKLGLKDNVVITGFVDESLVASALRTTTIVISASDTDTLPISLLESLASGKPIVAVYDSAFLSIVHHEKNGLLVAKDPKAIEMAILKLLTNQKLMQSYGAKSKELAKDFSITKCVDDLEKLYRECISQKQIFQPKKNFFSFLTKKW